MMVALSPSEPWHLPICALLAVLLDRLLGEPRRWHPLVGFGNYAHRLEAVFRRFPDQARLSHRDSPRSQKISGNATWALAVLPWVVLAFALRNALPTAGGWMFDTALLTFALGGQSLHEHLRPIAERLSAGDLPGARLAVGRIVSRETSELDSPAIARAAVESTLENGHDAVFGTLFWFFVGGGPAALLFRLANTLDAMWGYRNDRYLNFGWAAARFDDVLGYLPARLCAITYALLGRTQQALACWRQQAPLWDSPNAGPVMAAGAGSLGVTLGGAAIYHGRREERPALGCGPSPTGADIRRGLTLVDRGVALWLAIAIATALILELIYA